MKRVVLLYASLILVLASCAQFEPPTTDVPNPNFTLSTQAAAPEMRVRSVSLDSETKRLLGMLKSSTTYRDYSARFNPERVAAKGDVKGLGRGVNQHVSSYLNTLRITGDRELLEKVYGILHRARGALRDTNGDGYLNWVYQTEETENRGLLGTDKHVMEEIMAHAMVARGAYALKLNCNVSSKYCEEARFWVGYLKNHYEAKWRKRTGKRSGYPIIEKDLMHPYTKGTLYYYMHKLTGDYAYKRELDRRVGVLKRALFDGGGGSRVWTHSVNEFLHSRGKTMRWNYQPTGYGGETINGLVDLGLEGALDETTMRGVAKTLTIKLLDEKSDTQIMAGDVGGSKAQTVYVPYLNKRMTLRSPGYPRAFVSFFVRSGFASLAPWDSTGEVARDSATYYGRSKMYPHAVAGIILGRRFNP